MILQRNGLTLIQGSPFEGARGSRNVPIQLVHDSSYADYGFTMHCGYFVNGVEQETLLAVNAEGDFLIPGEAYADYGPIKLSVQLSKTGEADYMTNQLAFTVEPAPFGKVILPSTATWQELVGQYTQSLLDGYTNTVLEPKTAELSKMISDYNTELSNYTTDVLDVYEKRIEDDIIRFEQEYGDAYTPVKAVTFTEAEEFTNIASGETFPIMLGKLKQWFKRFKYVYKGHYTNKTDLNDIVGISVSAYCATGSSGPLNRPVTSSGLFSSTYIESLERTLQKYEDLTRGDIYTRTLQSDTITEWVRLRNYIEYGSAKVYLSRLIATITFTDGIGGYTIPAFTDGRVLAGSLVMTSLSTTSTFLTITSSSLNVTTRTVTVKVIDVRNAGTPYTGNLSIGISYAYSIP